MTKYFDSAILSTFNRLNMLKVIGECLERRRMNQLSDRLDSDHSDSLRMDPDGKGIMTMSEIVNELRKYGE